MWKYSEKRVLVPKAYLSWLSMRFEDVYRETKRLGIRAIATPIMSDFENDLLDKTRPLPEDAVFYAVAVETEEIAFDIQHDFPESVERWRRRLSSATEIAKRCILESKINLALVVQGHEPYNAVIRHAALSTEIPVLAIENTALSNRFIWDNVSGITTNRNLAKNYFWRLKGLFSQSVISSYVAGFRKSLRTHKSDEHASPCSLMKVKQDRPAVLFLGQVFTDSSVVFGIGRWLSPIALMQAVCQWCNDNAYQLIVKLHPKEVSGKDPINFRHYNKLTFRKIKQCKSLMQMLDDNRAVVDADNRLDTYALIDSCRFAVTVNSQSGLEAAAFGRPTVVAGDAFYGGLGFTLDAPDPCAINRQLRAAESYSVPSSAAEFAYIFFEHYCKPKTPRDLAKLISRNV